MYRQTRSISFKSLGSVFGSSSSAAKAAKKEVAGSASAASPTAATAGASIEPIRFEVLGPTSNLLSVKLPKSSVLNVRYNNLYQKLIAVNGDVEKLYVELTKKLAINSSRDLMVYQRCFNSEGAMNLLFALNAQNANFSVLSVDKDMAPWMVKRDSLVAWSGNYLDVNMTKKLSQLAQVTGTGSFALASPGQLSQITLAEGESILVNPRSVVAYTSTADLATASDELTAGAKNLVDLSVPRVSGAEQLGHYWSVAKQKVSDTFVWFQERAEKQKKLVEAQEQAAKLRQMELRSGVNAQFQKLSTVQKSIAAFKEAKAQSAIQYESAKAAAEAKVGEKTAMAAAAVSAKAAPVTEKLAPIGETATAAGKTVATAAEKYSEHAMAIEVKEEATGVKFGEAVSSAWGTFTSKLGLYWGKLASGSNQSYMIEFKGPKTLLINNALPIKSEALSRKEISELKL